MFISSTGPNSNQLYSTNIVQFIYKANRNSTTNYLLLRVCKSSTEQYSFIDSFLSFLHPCNPFICFLISLLRSFTICIIPHTNIYSMLILDFLYSIIIHRLILPFVHLLIHLSRSFTICLRSTQQYSFIYSFLIFYIHSSFIDSCIHYFLYSVWVLQNTIYSFVHSFFSCIHIIHFFIYFFIQCFYVFR